MKYGIFLSLSCLLAVPHVYSGASGEKLEKPKLVEKKVVFKGFAMTASLPEKSIAGSAIKLRIKLENQGKEEAIWISFLQYSDYDLKVLNAKGEPVGNTQFGKSVGGGIASKTGSGLMVRLAPGKEMEQSINLARIFDLTVPGQYTLEAVFGPDLKIENITFEVTEEPR